MMSLTGMGVGMVSGFPGHHLIAKDCSDYMTSLMGTLVNRDSRSNETIISICVKCTWWMESL